MSELITLRRARLEDCDHIARLFLISSDGLAEYIWRQVAEPGESLEETGRRRYAREGVAFSYQNCILADLPGQTIGMLHAFKMPEPDGEAESDPVLRPYAELEDPGSLYISSVAIYPDHRGRGAGQRLLAAAHRRAQTLGLGRVSLICFEGNEGAMRLYRRLGYRETARRAIVPHPSLHYAEGDAVLLVKAV
ncbi:MAG: GNAT family N-acetyltransferase [Pseudomonadota bacterium]